MTVFSKEPFCFFACQFQQRDIGEFGHAQIRQAALPGAEEFTRPRSLKSSSASRKPLCTVSITESRCCPTSDGFVITVCSNSGRGPGRHGRGTGAAATDRSGRRFPPSSRWRWDIDADLDDRCGNQDIQCFIVELLHRFLFVFGGHAAVQQSHSQIREHIL